MLHSFVTTLLMGGAFARRLQKDNLQNGLAVQEFIIYALTKPDTIFITYSDLIAWMQARGGVGRWVPGSTGWPAACAALHGNRGDAPLIAHTHDARRLHPHTIAQNPVPKGKALDFLKASCQGANYTNRATTTGVSNQDVINTLAGSLPSEPPPASPEPASPVPPAQAPASSGASGTSMVLAAAAAAAAVVLAHGWL